MVHQLIGGKFLTVDREANRLHGVGLRAELSGDYTAAHTAFAAATDILDVPVTVDAIVQRARIIRDDGFTFVRSAIDDADASMLDMARETITRSIESTAPIVSGTRFADMEGNLPHDTPKKARREVFAEHGATVSLLGRVATVGQVMSATDTRESSRTSSNQRINAQQPYGLAHDMLRLGTNGYYRVSNAMVGARQERLNGRIPHMGVWLGRAAVGLAWTAMRDRGNFKAAARTFAGRSRHLRSYKAAVASVLTAP